MLILRSLAAISCRLDGFNWVAHDKLLGHSIACIERIYCILFTILTLFVSIADQFIKRSKPATTSTLD